MSLVDQHNKTNQQLSAELANLRVQLRKLDPQLENKYIEILREAEWRIQNPEYFVALRNNDQKTEGTDREKNV